MGNRTTLFGGEGLWRTGLATLQRCCCWLPDCSRPTQFPGSHNHNSPGRRRSQTPVRLFLTDYNRDGGGLTLQTLRSTSRSSDLGSLLISFVDRMEGWLFPGLVVGGYIVSRLFNI